MLINYKGTEKKKNSAFHRRNKKNNKQKNIHSFMYY